MITLPNNNKEIVPLQSSLRDPSQNTTPFINVRSSLHGSKKSVNDEMETQEASKNAPSCVKKVSKFSVENKTYEPDSS